MLALRLTGPLFIFLCFLQCILLIAPVDAAVPDPTRVTEIASWLPEKPTGLGAPITDRDAWNRFGQNPAFKNLIAEAERQVAKPAPQLTDELYLEFSRNGNRTNFQKADNQLTDRLRLMVLAECLENKGRFLPDIEARILQTCALKSWALPAHDASLECFHGKRAVVNIQSARKSWDMACYSWLLGDRLSKTTQQLIYNNVRRRVLDPVRKMYEGKQRRANWVTNAANHNSVCSARVTGAALALLESREDRALYVAASEHYIKKYLNGFSHDGYCSEGLTYWNYGFGRFLALTETIYQATEGKLDLLQFPNVKQAAMSGWNTQLTQHVSPAFADSSVDETPNLDMVWYLRKRLNLPIGKDDFIPAGADSDLPDTLIFAFPNSATNIPTSPLSGDLALRNWFSDGQMLVSRPAPKAACRLSVAMKGGHNAEKHNHNDVGTYVVALDNVAILCDPGREVYSRDSFTRRRYDRTTNNSFGHPVPVVAGKLQKSGRKAKAKILRTSFSDQADILELDITAAYNVQSLQQLIRTFSYDRNGAGSFTICDKVLFDSPQSFETTMITLGKVEMLSENALRITQEGKIIKITAQTEGVKFDITQVTLKGNYHIGKQPTRLSFQFKEPVLSASIKVLVEVESNGSK